MMQDMARLLLLMFGIGLILTILALISCLSAEPGEVRALPRVVWVVVILVIPVVGAIMYLSAGRPLPEYTLGTGLGGGASTGGGSRIWRTAAGLSTREQHVAAPDDDPDFLRGIDTNRLAKDEEMLRRWEEEFRKRDEEPPKPDKSIDDPPPSDG
jgi:hypothetical protein